MISGLGLRVQLSPCIGLVLLCLFGLRGLRIGDAQVSEKHTGFVVNLGSATAPQTSWVSSQGGESVTFDLGQTESFTITSEVVIAETVIVGTVPNTFLQTGGNYEPQREN